jgi:DNA-directed RNA polymerase specialized sigma24 family protein
MPLEVVSLYRAHAYSGESAVLSDGTIQQDFSEFVTANERGLRQALTAWFGPDLGRDASAEALAYGWEHWDRVRGMDNPTGYLYRVGLSWGRRRAKRRDIVFPVVPVQPAEFFEPGLPEALRRLSDKQRVVVYLVHGHDWSLSEVADLLEVSKGTVQTHLERGMSRLRRRLKVDT